MQEMDASEGPILDLSMEEVIFHQAQSFTELAARREYVHLACRGDEALRRRIESLLEAAKHVGSFMNCPAVNAVVTDSKPPEWPQEPLPVAADQRVPSELCQPGRDITNRPISAEFDTSSSDDTIADIDPLIGRTLGHYRIDSLIGTGGMAEVYLAQDLRLGRKIALKIIAPPINDRQPRFLREAQLASALDHPNVCAVYDVGVSSGY